MHILTLIMNYLALTNVLCLLTRSGYYGRRLSTEGFKGFAEPVPESGSVRAALGEVAGVLQSAAVAHN